MIWLLLPLLATPAHASPWCGTPERLRLRAERGEHPAHARPAPPPQIDMGVCTDPQALADQEGYDGTFDQYVRADHFVVVWDAANPAVDEAIAQTYADLLTEVWTAEIDERGWLAPDESDTCLITVLLADFPAAWSGTGGYTNAEDTGELPYMVLNTDWLEYGDDWTATLVAHEFNHASQFAYNAFWNRADWWYWEATAEWIPDLIFDDANTYVWSLWAYYDAPYLALSSEEEYVNYGHFAFNTYLEEQHGEAMPRTIWEEAMDGGGVGDAIAGLGYDFDAVTVDWASHMAALDVTEADTWLESIGYFAIDPYAFVVTDFPASGDVSDDTAPQERGQNFVHLSGGSGTLEFQFAGEASVEDQRVNWSLGLATVASDGTIAHSVVEADENGDATVTVSGFGSDWTEVTIAVVPLGEIDDAGAPWSWAADVLPEEDDTGEPAKDVACGCASASPRGTWGLGALALAMVLQRRRDLSRANPTARP